MIHQGRFMIICNNLEQSYENYLRWVCEKT